MKITKLTDIVTADDIRSWLVFKNATSSTRETFLEVKRHQSELHWILSTITELGGEPGECGAVLSILDEVIRWKFSHAERIQ